MNDERQLAETRTHFKKMSVYLTKELYEELKTMSIEQDRKIAYIIRNILKENIKK